MKKKLIMCMAFLGLAIASLFTSPILGNAADTEPLQEEPVVLAETKVNTPYEIKNENGVKTTIINSGRVYSQLDIGGLYDSDALDFTVGNVIVSSEWLYDESTFDYYNIFEIPNVSVDFNFMLDSQAGQAWNDFQSSYCDSIAVYGFSDKNNFSEFIELAFYNISEENADIDIFYTDYTWCEKDLTAPSIGGSVHASVNVDNQPSIDEIVSHVYAYDETDGYVPVVIESSTYVPGVMQVGDYVINISASDAASNKTLGKIDVHRFDSTGPVISGTSSYDLNYDHDLTLSKIEAALSISDNVDSGLTLQKISDTFTGNEHTLGNYQVVYRTVDYSSNYSANKTIDIAVKNKGTSTIGGAREIRVGTNQVLTLAEFKSHVSVVDGYDGTITNYTITGFDDYTASSKVVGTNIVRVSYTNSGNNTAYADFNIIKEDKLAPGFLFDDYFIMLKQGEVFTLDMIMDQAAIILNLDIAQIESVSGKYDTMTLGDYDIEVCLATGETKTFTLSVVDDYSKVSNKTSNNFFSTSDFNFLEIFNFSNHDNWTFWHYGSWVLIGIIIIAGAIFFYKKRKKSNK